MEQMKSPILQFDFLTDEESKPVIFSNPIEVIQTNELTNVATCLDKVDQAVKKGFYVAGYMSYEAAYAFHHLQILTPNNKMPLIWFGVFHEPISHNIPESIGYEIHHWKIAQTKAQYKEKFQQIIDAIYNQKTDQINYTVPFYADFTGNAYSYYKVLKNAQRANYNAFLDIDDFQILSASPELFFQLKNNIITVKPMKGTVHRGLTYEEDLANKRWLQSSTKNKQENNLITELMKQELKQIADETSIKVIDQYKVAKYPTVYQMTSTVIGERLPNQSVINIMKALFPCGSISGVPKTESIKMINQLESNPREVYCGAIGYITPDEEAIFNVPIRTVMIDEKKKQAMYGAGGAITIHSNVDEEYEEMVTKTKILHWEKQPFQLLETFGLYDGNYIVFDEHLQRLIHSAAYFDFPLHIAHIKEKLLQIASIYQTGAWRVRLTVSETGNEQIEVIELQKTNNRIVKLAKTPIVKNNPFLYHKTTNRSLYEQHTEDEVFDVLLWNEQNEITEFTIGNVVVELHGELFTPPVESGLLPGTFRAKLLREEKVKQRKLMKTDLHKCSRIWLVNSVRQWVEVNIKV